MEPLTGVQYLKSRKRWIVRQTINGKRRQVTFKTLPEANYYVSSSGDQSVPVEAVNGEIRELDPTPYFSSQSEKSPNPSRSSSGLRDGGDQASETCIGEPEANYWTAKNGDRADQIKRSGNVVLVQFTSKRKTVHYEVSHLENEAYNFCTGRLGVLTYPFRSRREATKQFNRLAKTA